MSEITQERRAVLVVYGALGPASEERALARRLLALALAREYGVTAVPETARTAAGKPFFPGCPHIHFSLSHSRGAAVCALHHQPVGVDVEQLRPAPRHLAGEMDSEAFFRLWTAREATIKREGRGLGALLRPLEPDSRCRCLEGFLPGWTVTVCPTVDMPARTVYIAP